MSAVSAAAPAGAEQAVSAPTDSEEKREPKEESKPAEEHI